jgi:hypothetical protein
MPDPEFRGPAAHADGGTVVGTGYSILSRLQDFPIDTLKIDRSFISRITTLDSDSPIVSATVAMALGLGLAAAADRGPAPGCTGPHVGDPGLQPQPG